MERSIKNILKWYLLFTSIYLFADGIIHILNLKLANISSNWSSDLVIYAQYMTQLYGLFAVLTASFGLEVSRNLSKYKNLLYIAAIWGIVYAGFLIYYSITIDYPAVFKSTPSIYFWIPFYNAYILFEGLLLFTLSCLIFIYKKYN